jgi:hypothetical protein
MMTDDGIVDVLATIVHDKPNSTIKEVNCNIRSSEESIAEIASYLDQVSLRLIIKSKHISCQETNSGESAHV